MTYRNSKIDLKNERFKNRSFKGIKKKIAKKHKAKNPSLIAHAFKTHSNFSASFNKKIFLALGFVSVLSAEDYKSSVYWLNSVNENNSNKSYYISPLRTWAGGNRSFTQNYNNSKLYIGTKTLPQHLIILLYGLGKRAMQVLLQGFLRQKTFLSQGLLAQVMSGKPVGGRYWFLKAQTN